MLKMNKTAILLAFAAAVCAASCSKSNNNNVTPASITYPYSFNDPFVNDTNGWIKIDAIHNLSITVSGGYLNFIYHPTTTNANFKDTVNPAFDTKHDFVLQTSVQSDHIMGLAFGTAKADYGYTFEIDNNGNYGLFHEGDSLSARSTILNWAKTPAANPGGANVLEIDQTAGEWYGYVNGVRVFSVTARPLLGSTIGIVAEANTNGTADYINVKWD